MEEQPFSEATRATRPGHSADILLYEDNEQMLGRSEHGQGALRPYIMGHEP